MTPGQRFADLIARKGHNQSTLSGAIGITDQTISNFVNGVTQRMQLRAWRAVADEFRMSVEELNADVFGANDVAGRIGVRKRWESCVLALLDQSDIDKIEAAGDDTRKVAGLLIDIGQRHLGGRNAKIAAKKYDVHKTPHRKK